jgi:hypothetical protein
LPRETQGEENRERKCFHLVLSEKRPHGKLYAVRPQSISNVRRFGGKQRIRYE